MLIAPNSGAFPWPTAMIVWGAGDVSSEHRHHSVQLILALTESLRIRRGEGEPWHLCDAALVRADAPHEVDARGATVLIAFIEPESPLGAALAVRIPADIAHIPAAEAARWRGAVCATGSPSDAGIRRWLEADLLGGRPPPTLHPGVRRVLRHVRNHLQEPDALSLRALAVVAGLSPSRLMHAFTGSMGIALRPYLLWLRLQLACAELTRGASATEAALQAGFADAAHLSRTCRRMLGTTPTAIAASKARCKIE
ncbi:MULTISPECIES: helix-turn-helix domain-containing protein [Paraburkholderia]|uniref:Helix-turn-helix transcriptional regulator n=1 Tax=Paraburkholderia podalyriae TaxID=1938811 RepID=A0ABR7PSM6_9BURK|nr:AraC family transcriptional regulator [Paraburkholderia podalyriae]MBC8749277.1 helix-turn-helix transcriptional regulator [Paraburkholderia podalyriae]